MADVIRDMNGTLSRAEAMSGDAVFRIPGTDGGPDRFVVSDYKTNLVHTPADPDPALAYGPERLAAEMARHGYFVQSLIYTVALHRYLRWRLADYDYDTPVGGVSYLFLRGLTGRSDESGHPLGIYEWRPPRSSVEALDRLFAGERS
jgi:exodeoxyribonuclease V beta subunit